MKEILPNQGLKLFLRSACYVVQNGLPAIVRFFIPNLKQQKPVTKGISGYTHNVLGGLLFTKTV